MFVLGLIMVSSCATTKQPSAKYVVPSSDSTQIPDGMVIQTPTFPMLPTKNAFLLPDGTLCTEVSVNEITGQICSKSPSHLIISN